MAKRVNATKTYIGPEYRVSVVEALGWELYKKSLGWELTDLAEDFVAAARPGFKDEEATAEIVVEGKDFVVRFY